MIERLVRSLEGLAAGDPASAGEFADALLLAESCQQEMLSADERSALTAVDLALERALADPGGSAWDETRKRARIALLLMRAE
jgi:hypothetical protein